MIEGEEVLAAIWSLDEKSLDFSFFKAEVGSSRFSPSEPFSFFTKVPEMKLLKVSIGRKDWKRREEDRRAQSEKAFWLKGGKGGKKRRLQDEYDNEKEEKDIL